MKLKRWQEIADFEWAFETLGVFDFGFFDFGFFDFEL